MREVGIDISANRPKALTDAMLDAADLVVTMGCGAQAVCPAAFAETEDWELEDPDRRSEILSPYGGADHFERQRAEASDGVDQGSGGEAYGREAAEVLGLSLRHVRRLKAAYLRAGPAALAHGNRYAYTYVGQ